VDFRLPEKFSLIYFPSCSFDHILDPADQRAALHNIREHLAPGGRYVFDLYLTEGLNADRGWFVQRKTLEDGSQVIRSGYHVARQEKRLMSLDMWYDHVVDGRVAERYYEGSDVYVHDAEEVRWMLGETGYEVVEEYGDHHGKPYEEGDGMIVFVTRPRK
jgi:SAM-dependent methyltransferase